MKHADTQLMAKDGLVHGVPKRSLRPLVDGIITGIPKVAKPSVATPVSSCHSSATSVPAGAFGSGIFGEGAGAAKHSKAEPVKKGTTKGEPRKTARKAYE